MFEPGALLVSCEGQWLLIVEPALGTPEPPGASSSTRARVQWRTEKEGVFRALWD